MKALRLALVFGSAPAFGASDQPVGYNRDVLPILADICFTCHGFDKAQRIAGLRLDSAAGAGRCLSRASGPSFEMFQGLLQFVVVDHACCFFFKNSCYGSASKAASSL